MPISLACSTWFGNSPDHGIIRTASLGDLEGLWSGRQRWSAWSIKLHAEPEFRIGRLCCQCILDAGCAEPITRLILSVDALDTGRAYACAGIGIIGAFGNWLEPAFAAGTLVPVLPDLWRSIDGPRLYCHSRFGSAALRAFIDVCRDVSVR